MENTRAQTNNRMQREQNDLGVKYGKRNKHNKNIEWISNMKKKLQKLEE